MIVRKRWRENSFKVLLSAQICVLISWISDKVKRTNAPKRYEILKK